MSDKPTVEFPLESFKDAAQHLRRPFTPAAVKFKVQSTWNTGGLIVGYIDARLAEERLNLIVPHLWSDHYARDGELMWCHLTVDGITRSDVGEGRGKALVSDALKRAAVKFGVGVSLYAIPKMMLNVSDGHLKEKQGKLALTYAGEKHVRARYTEWLEKYGAAAFGDPLDHGDAPDAQGDTEVDGTVEQASGGNTPVADPAPAEQSATNGNPTSDDIEELKAAATGLTIREIKLALTSCAIPFDRDESVEKSFRRTPAEKVPLLAEALASMART